MQTVLHNRSARAGSRASTGCRKLWHDAGSRGVCHGMEAEGAMRPTSGCGCINLLCFRLLHKFVKHKTALYTAVQICYNETKERRKQNGKNF